MQILMYPFIAIFAIIRCFPVPIALVVASIVCAFAMGQTLAVEWYIYPFLYAAFAAVITGWFLTIGLTYETWREHDEARRR